MPGLYISAWQAVWTPKGTLAAIIDKLNSAIIDALTDATLQARLADLGEAIFPPAQQTPAALADWQKAEIETWWPIAKAARVEGQ